MKIFETPVINIKEFNREVLLEASGMVDPTQKTNAVTAARNALESVKNQNTSIFEFVAS